MRFPEINMFWIDAILYVMIYSFAGWVCECVYCSVLDAKLTNRGFLNGPFCPMYGVAAVVMVWALNFLPQYISVVFVGSVIIASLIEYVTSWGMEVLFKAKWWDYSKKRFNINGRVCLLNSTLFGILGVVLMFDLHPAISGVVTYFGYEFKMGFLIAFLMYFTFDLSVTLYSVLGLNVQLKRIAELKEKIETKYSTISEILSAKESEEKSRLEMAYENLSHKSDILKRRILDAFPDVQSLKYNKTLDDLKNHLKKGRNKNDEQ